MHKLFREEGQEMQQFQVCLLPQWGTQGVGQSLQTLCHRTLIMRHEFTGYTCAYQAGSREAGWCCGQDAWQLDPCSNPCSATSWLCDLGQIVPCLCILVTEHSG